MGLMILPGVEATRIQRPRLSLQLAPDELQHGLRSGRPLPPAFAIDERE